MLKYTPKLSTKIWSARWNAPIAGRQPSRASRNQSLRSNNRRYLSS
jgi:hypothetical protein